jgi:transposase
MRETRTKFEVFLMAINSCPVCLQKQREIDDLKEENRRLRSALHSHQRKMKEGAFGSSKLSSKIPIKPSVEVKEKKPKGARPGHPGKGRKDLNYEPVDDGVEVESESEVCILLAFDLTGDFYDVKIPS